ncbi:MAG: hypothetical protein WBQ94_23515 [Terracidiphilus sp.]
MWKKIKSAFKQNQAPELITIFSPQNPDSLTDYQRAFYAPPTTYSNEYPTIPKPKALTELDLLAAQWAAGKIWPEKMPGIAADLLESGLDSPSLRRLAGEMHVGCIADVREIVEKTFRELSVELPASGTAARQQTSVQIAREVIAGLRNPWNAAAELDRIWSYEIWHHKDLCDIAQLLDELDHPSISRGDLPRLTEELIGHFAELAA